MIDGSVAGVGDRIVTRANRRRLPVYGGRDFVKNGDLWTVVAEHPDRSLTVQHVRHRGKITLPADYVAEHVELGYAATVHRAQGLTVEIARSFLSPSAVREAALVALSRGVRANYAYFDVEEIQEVGEPEVLPGELFYRHRDTARVAEALAGILRREGAERSATEDLRSAQEEPFRLDSAVPRYEHGLVVWRGEAAAAVAEEWVREAMPDYADEILADEAWPALLGVLHEVRDAGGDPVTLLRDTADDRELDSAVSVAKVMHFRVSEAMPLSLPGSDRPSMLPGWVSQPPPLDDPRHAEQSDVLELAEWLHDRVVDIVDRVHELGQRVAEDRPRWATRLGAVPDDPVDRGEWIAVAGQVAAYRERWGIGDDVRAMLPAAAGGPQQRARQWVESYVDQHVGVLDVSHERRGRVGRLRTKVDAFTDRLATIRSRPRAQPRAEQPLEPEQPDRSRGAELDP